ncbi:uncharacterized protein LOC132554566 [Ylistrum balloti]|uniref:uncharacterized protein LOC132554566 n=1 Tax=Ylistrum balloti TaxID=509963 RepID=UPI002905CD88|nr:uncharacterized protein LOC132554566 [Ylistrum balloti]
MGCNNSKTDENTRDRWIFHCWIKRNKVASINIPTREEVATSLELSATLNAIRKTEQTALMQLKEQGVVPRKGEGGVAFVLQIEGESEANSISSTLPGVPEYKTKYPQYTTYSWEACRAATHGPPRRLPPINRASIDAKQERARRNREKKTAERKAKWAKSYARVQLSMQKSNA